MQPALGSAIGVYYCRIESLWNPLYVYKGNFCATWQNDNVSSDPAFADPNGGDFHLKSNAGRWQWDPDNPGWMNDDVASICIDAGDPNVSWIGELWPHGKRVNIGAYGGTPEASLSLSNAGNPYDLTGDDFVNMKDLAKLGERWLDWEPPSVADLDRDGFVDFRDLRLMAENWLLEEQ
jgi:hypothetical protein